MVLPFLDRSPERRPAHRKTAMAAAIIILVLLAGLSFMGYREHFLTPLP
jgi:quinol-cytochrome oxidoreductase complex cytochrome b subunit